MVDNSITPTKFRLNVNVLESSTGIEGELTVFRAASIEQLQNVEDPNSTEFETDYNVLVDSNGAAGPVTGQMHYRAIVKKVGSPISIPSFFTSVNIGESDQFHAKGKADIGQGVSYDLFYTYGPAGGSTTDLDLTVQTIEVPDSASTVPQDAIALPAVPNVTDPVKQIAILRQVQGTVRVYDVLTLSQP